MMNELLFKTRSNSTSVPVTRQRTIQAISRSQLPKEADLLSARMPSHSPSAKTETCNYLALVTILNIVEPSGNTTRIVHATLSTRNEANRVICSQPEESEWPRRPVAFKLVTTLDVVGSSHTTISAKPSKSRANARASSMRAACLVGCLTDTGPRPRFARELRIGHSSCRSREAVVRRNGDSG